MGMNFVRLGHHSSLAAEWILEVEHTEIIVLLEVHEIVTKHGVVAEFPGRPGLAGEPFDALGMGKMNKENQTNILNPAKCVACD